jgi:hypothetical protein
MPKPVWESQAILTTLTSSIKKIWNPLLFTSPQQSHLSSLKPQSQHRKTTRISFSSQNLLITLKMQFQNLIVALSLSSAALGAAVNNLSSGLAIRAAGAPVAASLSVVQSPSEVVKRDMEK